MPRPSAARQRAGRHHSSMGNAARECHRTPAECTAGTHTRCVTAQVYAPKLVVIYIGSNDLSAAQCNGGEATLMAAVPGIVSRCASMASVHLGLFAALPHDAL